MSEQQKPSLFVDISGASPRPQKMWSPIVIRKSQIDEEIERLIDLPPPVTGRRAAMITHPEARAPGLGFAPGTDVTINVLKPGEETIRTRRNSNLVEITLSGEGDVLVDGVARRVSERDVWTIPPMRIHEYVNKGKTPWVRLSYSNAPILEMLEVHFYEEFDGHTPPSDIGKTNPSIAAAGNMRARDAALNEQIAADGAAIRGYEWLLDIDAIESKFMHWPYEEVKKFLPSAEALAKDYNGRRVLLLYNPSTERRMGTSSSFFATISCSPPNNNYIPHRHTSSAINYYLNGEGYSKVEGERLEWKAGDLLLSAPGWATHSHHSTAPATSALTIQDHPFHIGMNSLVWQERMNEKILALGAQPGFETNLAAIKSA